MEAQELLAITEAVDKGFSTVGSKLETQFAELNETAKKVLTPKTPDEIKSPAEVEATSKADKAEMEQLGGITSMQVWDIPIGQAVVGGFIAVFSSELIDGFLAAQSGMIRGFVKLAAAGVSVKWGSRVLGSTGAKAVALLLAYDGIRSILPIDEWASNLAGGIKPLTGAGLGGKAGMDKNPGGNGHQARSADYYAGAFGR